MMTFTTNQFRLKISEDAPTFYQYPISIHSEESEETHTYAYSPFELNKIVRRVQPKFETLLGQFLHWGQSIWTTQRLEETFIVDSSHLN